MEILTFVTINKIIHEPWFIIDERLKRGPILMDLHLLFQFIPYVISIAYALCKHVTLLYWHVS